jgi:hypothetical protein
MRGKNRVLQDFSDFVGIFERSGSIAEWCIP